jgi:hypothetical protein
MRSIADTYAFKVKILLMITKRDRKNPEIWDGEVKRVMVEDGVVMKVEGKKGRI